MSKLFYLGLPSSGFFASHISYMGIQDSYGYIIPRIIIQNIIYKFMCFCKLYNHLWILSLISGSNHLLTYQNAARMKK